MTNMFSEMILSSLMRTHDLSLSDEAFLTFMAEVAAVFNSRPLTVDNLSNSDDHPPLSSFVPMTVDNPEV